MEHIKSINLKDHHLEVEFSEKWAFDTNDAALGALAEKSKAGYYTMCDSDGTTVYQFKVLKETPLNKPKKEIKKPKKSIMEFYQYNYFDTDDMFFKQKELFDKLLDERIGVTALLTIVIGWALTAYFWDYFPLVTYTFFFACIIWIFGPWFKMSSNYFMQVINKFLILTGALMFTNWISFEGGVWNLYVCGGAIALQILINIIVLRVKG